MRAIKSMFNYVIFGMCFGHFCYHHSLALQLDPSVRSMEAFTESPFEINCDEETLKDLEANKDLVLEWINPQGEIIGSSKDMPKPTNQKLARVGRILEKFKDLVSNVMSMMKAYAALVIENKQSSGVYRCVLRDAKTDEVLKQMPIKVMIYKTIEFEAAFEQETTALENLSFELVCNIKFDPDLTNTKVTWMKNGHKIVQNPRVFVKESVAPNVKSRLVFKRIRQDDVGEYACRASQSTGSVSQTRMAVTSLQVKEPAREDFDKLMA